MSYVVVARCVAQDEHKDEIEAVLREFVPQCRREPGHHDFVAQKSVERPNEFLLYEHFVTEQDFVDYGALQGTSVPTILLGSPAACARGRKSAPACATPLALYTDRAASPFGEPPDLREPEASLSGLKSAKERTRFAGARWARNRAESTDGVTR